MDCTSTLGFIKCFFAANLAYAVFGLALLALLVGSIAIYAVSYFAREKLLLKKLGVTKIAEYRYVSLATYRAQIEKLVAAGLDLSEDLVASSTDGYLYFKFLGQKPQDVGLVHPGNKVVAILASHATPNIILNIRGFYLPGDLLEEVEAPAVN